METIEKIGSKELAEEISQKTDEDAPSGWTYLGRGSYRRTFQGPDGFVYKVDRYPGNKPYSGFNSHENRTFVELTERGFLWIPQFTFYQTNNDQDIMVVQFLRDTSTQDLTVTEENRKRCKEIEHNVLDAGIYNFGVDPTTGLIYLRDGGNGSY